MLKINNNIEIPQLYCVGIPIYVSRPTPAHQQLIDAVDSEYCRSLTTQDKCFSSLSCINPRPRQVRTVVMKHN